VLAEATTAAMLLPTAALGASIRLLLKLCGKEKWVTFGPPPSKKKPDEATTRTAG